MRALPNPISVYSVLNSGAPLRRYLPLTNGELCLVVATAFTSELLLFSYHSATHNGPEGYYHHLLVLLIGLCVLATVLGELPCRPRHQHAHCAAGAVVLFYQTAFSLYGPMLPDGCGQDADGSVDCHSRAAEERAEQLANLQLFGAVFLAFVYALGCYAVAAARHGHPDMAAMHDQHVAALECHAGAGTDAAEDCVI